MEPKTCFKCERSLPRSDFYRHSKMADGLLGKCKECTKTDVTAHRWREIDRVREYDKQRSKLPHRLDAMKVRMRAYAAKHPKETRARTAVNNAVRDGRLQRTPCVVCGYEMAVGHHPDYDKPLSVVWLCRPCHAAVHLGRIECPEPVSGRISP